MATSEASLAPKLWPVILGLLLAMALAQLDQSIVAPALPQIAREFGGLEHFQWIVSAFMLSSTVSMPVYGRLGDLHGRKRVLTIALAIFSAGAVLCAAANSMLALIIARAVQGLGAGGVITQVQASIGDVVPPQRRAHYQSMFMSVFAACGICGPVLGGLITQSLSWRWIFLLNLPIALAAVLVLSATLKNSASVTRAPQPLLPRQLLANTSYLSALAVTVCGALALFGAMVFLPMHLQATYGVSALQTGTMLIPFTAGLLLATLSGSALVPRAMSSRALLSFGLLVAFGANIAMSLLIHVRGSTMAIEIMLGIIGLGNGWFMPSAIALVQDAAPSGTLGIATAMATFFRSLAGAIGVVLAGAVIGIFLRNADGPAHIDARAYQSGLTAVFSLSALLVMIAWCVERMLLRRMAHAEKLH